MLLFVVVLFFQLGSCCVVHAGLKLVIHLPPHLSTEITGVCHTFSFEELVPGHLIPEHSSLEHSLQLVYPNQELAQQQMLHLVHALLSVCRYLLLRRCMLDNGMLPRSWAVEARWLISATQRLPRTSRDALT